MARDWERIGEIFKEKNIEKLKIFIENLTEKLKKEKIPVTKDGRLDMEAFCGVYSSEILEKDIAEINKLESEWYPNIPKDQIPKQKIKKEGEQLEIFKTAIFSKFLGKEYISIRTSLYDDYENHVDNIILEKKTGNLVCALDEVTAMSGPEFEKKKERVYKRNQRGGASLKYGLSIKEGRIRLGEVKKAPIFYLALNRKILEKGLEEFIPSEEKSDFEKFLFGLFLHYLKSQIEKQKGDFTLPLEIRENIKQFGKILANEKFKVYLERFEEKFKTMF